MVGEDERSTCRRCLDKMAEASKRYRSRKKEELAHAKALQGEVTYPHRVVLPPGVYYTRATNPVMGHLRWGRAKAYWARALVASRGNDFAAHRALAVMAAVERGFDPREAVR